MKLKDVLGEIVRDFTEGKYREAILKTYEVEEELKEIIVKVIELRLLAEQRLENEIRTKKRNRKS
ncbi:MAG: hypothetical protein QXG39_06060 [Candidatus Aenigmatarchaeota archaeon]